MRTLLKIAVWLALGFVACAAVIVLTFVGFAHFAREEADRRGQPMGANAIKHAFTASEAFTRLNLVFPDETSRAITLALGEWNERVENRIAHDVDVEAEAYKDMRNNVYGVAIALWLRDGYGVTDSESRLRLAGWLGGTRELPFYAEDRRLPKLPPVPNVDGAIAAIRADEPSLETAFFVHMDANRAAIERDLGLVSRADEPRLPR